MDSAQKYTLGKRERISGTKRIEQLFSAGDSFIAYPLRVVCMRRSTADEGVSVLVSVSKRKFKRAVKRNRIKRLIREAFRLNKEPFLNICQQYGTGLDMAFLFLKNELSDFREIENAIIKAASMLNAKLKKNAENE
jgi:ribonuclease P protein component